VKFAFEIDDDLKQEFLELLRQGMKPNRAATELNSTGTQFRRLRREGGAHYDAEFDAAWTEVETSAEHRRELEERVRDMVWDSAEDGNVTMRWKLALTYLPEFEWAKHQNLNINMQAQVIMRALPGLTMDELERVRNTLASGEQPVIEAAPVEHRAA